MDWKSLIATVAPWIGTALGGPLGGMAVTAAADALGLSEKTETALKTALSGASPADLLAIKQADQAFQSKMQELGFQNIKDMESIAAADRDSARNREIKTGDSATPRVLAGIVTVGFFGMLALLLFNGLPPAANEAALLMLGGLNSAFALVLGYYFGSTAGSLAKSKLLAQAAPPDQKA
tara:strand:+ start:4435 stop:4971 length:537 start_codon:yes stop_codon:yes gene_type:complete